MYTYRQTFPQSKYYCKHKSIMYVYIIIKGSRSLTKKLHILGHHIFPHDLVAHLCSANKERHLILESGKALVPRTIS